MSQSEALQPEIGISMTKSEGAQLALIEEKILIANFFKDAWVCIDSPNSTQIVNSKHHEPHEGCTGNLLIANIANIIGKPVYRRAISRLIARSPSMANLLEKALPIIEAEADMRDSIPGAPFSEREGYWTEMRELANEIKAEIDKARGK